MALATLSVQDAVWLNRALTGATHSFHYARLEEAVYLQYAGSAGDPVAGADALMRRFGGFVAFRAANTACGFALGVALLRRNGIGVQITDEEAGDWLVGADRNLASIVHASHAHDAPTVEAALRSVLDDFPVTLAALVAREGEHPAVAVSAPRLSGEFVGG